MVLLFLLIAALSGVVVWFGSIMLDDSIQNIGVYHDLPQVVKGAVLAAIGSSAPELSSVILSTLVHGKFVLGVAAIVGSAIFNILVIPGLSVIYAKGGCIHVSKDVVKGDGLFYTLSVAVLLIVFNMAVVYSPTGEPLSGTVSRPLALLPMALYGLYMFLQYQEYKESRGKDEDPEKETIDIYREYFLFICSITLIVISVEGLVYSGLQIGGRLGFPPTLWGLTVIAAITSLPDTKISFDAARRGEGDVSLANVFGSNIFDLCFCIPAGILIAGSAEISLTQAAPMMGLLVVATLTLFVMLRTDLMLTKGEGCVSLFIYTLFVMLLIGEWFGVANVLGGASVISH